MAGPLLTTDAVLTCPHGGTVSITPSSARVSAGGTVVVQTDTATVAGCPFTTPSNPSPCVRVQWVVADSRVTVNGAATLSAGSTGLCLSAAGAPQGPVVVVSTQPRAQSV